MPARTISSLDTITTNISNIFDQAQVSTANHQKNFIALYKFHTDAATHTESVHNGKSVKLTGARIVEDTILDMIIRVLPVKKGVSQVDRIIKFVGGYTKFVNEKAAEKSAEDQDDGETLASRFIARLLKFLLKGFASKDKSVRYRVVNLIAEMVSYLGEIDEEIYTLLRSSLLGRIHDKEPPIRVQAVIGLSKLSGSEDPADLEEGEPTVIDVLIDTLTHDPAADVRRAALLNIPISPITLASILERTRDTDMAIRKAVYSFILEQNTMVDDNIGLTHPKALTIAQRELIVRNGLGDRETSVKAAAASLVGVWVDVTSEKAQPKKVQDDVVALLKMFDLAENTIAEDALLSIFATRVDIFDNLELGESFWTEMTPETAFMARVFVEHCMAIKDEARLESALPVVTALAFRIQASYNNLLEDMQANEEDRLLRGDSREDEEDDERARREAKEEERIDREFIMGEMLKLAVNLDYADEIGRRKMFQLVRDMISQDTLPESLLARSLDVLRKLSPNERDLIRVVVEVVHELRDPSDPEDEAREMSAADDGESNFGETPMPTRTAPRGFPKPVAEMSAEERARADGIDLRCLSLCIGMLERVNGTFEENSTLEGILGELIIPAVKRKELALREKGLVSLGLCCLIARRMALNSFQLFLSQIQSAPEILKIRVLQIVFDILMVHEGEFLGKGGNSSERIVEFLLQVLDNEESDKVSALLCMGISKLMLSGMIADERVLKILVWSYVSPDTVDNQELRQCLAYFFPVYCYSSPANQRHMQQIFIPVFERLAQEYRELDAGQEMVDPAHIGAMFVDWTDPQNAVEVQGQKVDGSIHVEMASNIIKALFSYDIFNEDKKVLCQLLGKLYVPDVVDDDKIRTLKLLIHNVHSRRPLRDTTASNAFTRFDTLISKKFEKQLESFSEEEYRQLESLKELFEFLDDIIPDDDEEEVEAPKKRAGRKRRSESVISTVSEVEDTGRSKRKGASKSNVKRRRVSNSDEESEDNQTGATPPASTAPTRSLPKRAAASKKAAAPIHDGSEDKSGKDSDGSTPAPKNRGKAKQKGDRSKSAEEAKLDADIDRLLDGDISKDSIFDDEDEDEVSELLGSER